MAQGRQGRPVFRPGDAGFAGDASSPREQMLEPAVEALPRENLTALQEELLARQIARCAAGSPFYREKLVVRSFAELSDEFRIEVHAPGGMLVERCTVVCETQPGESGVEERLVRALRAELGVTPAVRFEPYGSLERFAFKAQRLVRL
jgi:phenylacetate-coenzyme A ligase PaaK-like adenylate-forming protein